MSVYKTRRFNLFTLSNLERVHLKETLCQQIQRMTIKAPLQAKR